MENPSESVLNFDLETTSAYQLLSAVQMSISTTLLAGKVHSTSPVVSLKLINARGQDFIGAGLRDVGDVSVMGSVGDYSFCSFGDGQSVIEGNVGNFFGHSIASGVLVVRGHAKHALGALGAGGLIAVYGNAQDRVGVGMQGTDIVVRGSVANHAGLGMQSGTLIVGGSAGLLLGQGMSGGTIYLRGEAESVSDDVEEQRLREPDRLKIGMLMLKSNFKLSGKEFRVFRTVREDS